MLLLFCKHIVRRCRKYRDILHCTYIYGVLKTKNFNYNRNNNTTMLCGS